MSSFDVLAFRQHFPILSKIVNDTKLVYFDNGATTHKPQCVIEKESEVYLQANANVHRASHALSAQATEAFELSRQTVQYFINAEHIEEVIWTKGTTESINLIAQSWGRTNLSEEDEIVLSESEHHANIVPWQIIAEQTGAKIRVLPLTASGTIDIERLEEVITTKTKLVCCAHISNVIGKINPIEQIIKRAKACDALTVIDGAQACGHMAINVAELDCDFYVFSAHKMYGPTGVGVLYGKKTLLTVMPPYQGGGEMIETVSFEHTSYNKLPFKFEAGTPNFAGVIAFKQAIDFINEYSFNQLESYERDLTRYAFEALSEIAEVQFIVEQCPDIGILSFTLKQQHNHDIASFLDMKGIAIRSGHHCAMPLMRYLAINGCIRLSIAPYNTFSEIDFFIQAIREFIADEFHDSSGIENTATVLLDEKRHNNLPEPITGSKKESDCKIDEMLERFSTIKAWDTRHREIMLLGKALVRMDKNKRNETTLISGCESSAWLSISLDEEGKYMIESDSDAKIIRGLLVIVLAAYQEKTQSEILDFDYKAFFTELGLLQHLSPSRGNGLNAIVQKIISFVEQS